MFWVFFVHDSMSNHPSFWFGFCFGSGESLALKNVLGFVFRLWKSLTQKIILFHNQPHYTFSSSPIKDPRESIPKLKFSPAWMVVAGFHHVMAQDDEDDDTKVECCCCCLNTKWWWRWWKMRLVVDDQDCYY